ncbi:MFS transporter [Fervidibacillus albus]|uniref:MFS transporter n=1 Tax=Fervidibacillus albus TaxID=2980026 RepID=A0A9E8LT52_9BACI|nr:MFS transporter [Fervidibacillus albus]WAA08915.1 MFS transporter [Fervidibacillus albus]
MPTYETKIQDKQPEQKGQKSRFWNEFKAGTKVLAKHRVLLSLTIINLGINIGSVGHLHIVLLKDQYGATATQFGLLQATGVATSIIGGLFIGRLIKKIKPISSLSIGLIVTSFTIILLGCFDQLILAFILKIIETFALLFYVITIQTLLITLVKPEFRARIDTLVTSISSFAMPLSIFITGYLADIIPLRYLFYVTGAWGIVMWVILLLNKEVRQLEKV